MSTFWLNSGGNFVCFSSFASTVDAIFALANANLGDWENSRRRGGAFTMRYVKDGTVLIGEQYETIQCTIPKAPGRSQNTCTYNCLNLLDENDLDNYQSVIA